MSNTTRHRPSKGYYSLMNKGMIVPRSLPMFSEVSLLGDYLHTAIATHHKMTMHAGWLYIPHLK